MCVCVCVCMGVCVCVCESVCGCSRCVSRGIWAVTEVAARPSNLQPNPGFGDSGVGPMDPKTVRATPGLAVADRNVLKTTRNKTNSDGRANDPGPP